MLSRPRPRTLLSQLATIVRRFRTEHMGNTAAALAFTTLLALVPLVTLIASVASFVPYFDLLIARFDQAVVSGLLPSGSAGVINAHVSKYALKARTLTVPGIAMLIVTAFLLMQTIERTFNHLWQVKPRPVAQRFGLYAAAMLLWPFVMGGLAALMSYAVTTSLGFFSEPPWVRKMLLKTVSVIVLGVFFTFLYYSVPNAKVSKWAALSGGIFATAMFGLMQKGFEVYLASIGTFKSIYGAFAAVPIFLIWVYLSWVVVLIGGLIAATLFRPARR